MRPESRPVLRPTVIACCFIGMSSAVFACLWDYDTLREEREAFPKTLELITGKFVRHSTAFYKWRVEDRLRQLEHNPNDPALYDDLAVAYDKTGNQAEAIAAILRKEKIAPDRYETAANLGTFHIHAGNFEKGLAHINRAIEMNPDAHFGREVYQKLLVEYVLKNRQDGAVVIPLFRHDAANRWTDERVFLNAETEGALGFGKFVLEKRPQPNPSAERAELRRAVKGVQGMMRFGHYDSPVLLEALGMLLLSDTIDFDGDAKRLAARAFLKASYDSTDKQAAADYRILAKSALSGQTRSANTTDQIKLEDVERKFKSELEEATEWFEGGIARDEARWIAAGLNVDELFDSKYRTEPTHPLGPKQQRPMHASLVISWIIVAILVAIGLLAAAVRFYLRRQDATRHPST